VFKAAHVEAACERAAKPLPTRNEHNMPIAYKHAIGGDLAGAGRAATVLVALALNGDSARVVDVQAWETEPAPILQAGIEDFAKRHGATPWLDRTGIGWGIIGNLSCPAVGVQFTGGNAITQVNAREWNVSRERLIGHLVLGLENGQIDVPRANQELVLGLRSYRWDKRKGRYADYVDALALAWWSATGGSRPPVLKSLATRNAEKRARLKR
jgi:hypothetical protein